jgi:hypothetical protein
MNAPPLLNLIFGDLSKLVHTRRIPCDSTLRDIRKPIDQILPHNRIRRRQQIDLDNPNSRILRSAIMLSIAQVTNPGLQAGGVVLVDDGAVGEDRGRAGEGGPFAGGVQEGDVDVPVGGEVVGFAGFGVGVEEEVDAAVLLFKQSVYDAQM